MDKLYNIALKMLKDKHNIDNYSRDKFNIIYYQIFNNNNNNNNNIELNELNELNKLVLKKINESIVIQDSNKNQNQNEIEIESKINELRNIRKNMLLNVNNEIKSNNEIKYKTFIINSIKNNFNTNINNKNNIYPIYISLPNFIKNLTPYIILSISDNYNNIVNYTFILNNNNNNTNNTNNWDIWKPVIDSYNRISLENTNWNIKIYDFNNNLISLNDYYSTIIQVLENNDTFIMKIDKIHLFNINDRIKIIFTNNTITDNIIYKIDINNQVIEIYKNNLNIQDFINSKIFNYNFQLSFIFKYH